MKTEEKRLCYYDKHFKLGLYQERKLAFTHTFSKGMQMDLRQEHFKSALEYIANLHFENRILSIDTDSLTAAFEDGGFSSEVYEPVMHWIIKLYQSGTLTQALGMIRPNREAPRVLDKLEDLAIPNALAERLQDLISKGIISHDIYEQLLEVLRSADTRDWDKDDVNEFIYELIENVRFFTGNHLTDGLIAGKKARDLYF